jgi:mRNA interferase RelE/StbE
MPKASAAGLSEYRIFKTEEFQRKADKLPLHDANAIRSKLTQYVYPQLREQPFYGANIRKLRGYTPDTWRYRIGRYRVFYIVDQEERIVYIVSIDARKDAYKKK